MIDTATLIAFSIAALFLLIIPGPGIMYLLVRSISQGRKAGFISSLGLSAGTLVHVLATTLGLSAVLLTSAVAFNVVKSLGALYLVYLGIQAILDRKPLQLTKPVKAVSLSQLFTDGFIVSVFNPKIAMFFIAFLPQFVAPTAGNTTLQMLNLG
jgi:threonine/homoserine/homoserine lactone efflux protein